MQTSLHMTLKDADLFYCATQEAHMVLGQAEDTFDLIATLIEEGDHANHPGIPAIARLARRALADLYDRYPDTLHDLSQRLKEALPKGGTE